MDVLSSITLNITSCCLLASIVSHEKSAFNLIESLLYMMNHFLSCCFQDSFFIQLSALCLQSNVNFFCSSSYFEFFWLLGCVDQCFFINFGKFSVTVSSDILSVFFLFWGSHYACFGIPDGVALVSDTPFTSLFFFPFPQCEQSQLTYLKAH